FTDNAGDKSLGVTEKHERFVQVVERIVDAGETGVHAALDDHDDAGFIHIENGHAIDRAGRIGAGGGVGDVVGADHQGNVGLREFAIHFLHFNQVLVGNVGFGQENVHVAGHSAGHRVNGEFHLNTPLGQAVV